MTLNWIKTLIMHNFVLVLLYDKLTLWYKLKIFIEFADLLKASPSEPSANARTFRPRFSHVWAELRAIVSALRTKRELKCSACGAALKVLQVVGVYPVRQIQRKIERKFSNKSSWPHKLVLHVVASKQTVWAAALEKYRSVCDFYQDSSTIDKKTFSCQLGAIENSMPSVSILALLLSYSI